MRFLGLANPAGSRSRLRRLLRGGLSSVAWNPSYRAPRAADVLTPAVPPEPPRISENERRLLDEVLANPEHDAPRLAYADWTELQGDRAYAELIRDQIAGRPAIFDAPHSRHHDRVKQFGASDLVFRRGFIEGMSLTGRAFISLGEQLLQLTPLTDLRLVAIQPYMAELAACRHLAHIRRLDLRGNHLRSAGLRELASSLHLASLNDLGLSGNAVGQDGIAVLVAAGWFRQLRALELADNGITATELPTLLTGLGSCFHALTLCRNPLGEEGAETLSRARFYSELQRLELSGCGIGPRGMESLRRGNPRELISCDLSFNAIGAEGTAALIAAEDFANLEVLHLGFNDIEDLGADRLANAAWPQLGILDLSANRITERGAASLGGNSSLTALTELNLTTNPLGDRGVIELMRDRPFENLKRLNLANCRLTDRGLAEFCHSGGLARLQTLSLAWNPIGDEAIRSLAACPDSAQLRELDLTGTRLGLAGAVALAESDQLRELQQLKLGENVRLPADAVTLLRERYNVCPG